MTLENKPGVCIRCGARLDIAENQSTPEQRQGKAFATRYCAQCVVQLPTHEPIVEVKVITARVASKLIKQVCVESKIPHTKVSAKTVSFSDLARGERIFVTVCGWERGYEAPSRYALLADVAKKNGFSVGVSERA